MKAIKSSEVIIAADSVQLKGFLNMPENMHAIVVFAHGSGSSRFSPRNQLVANILNEASFATLLFDLLSTEENEYDQVTAEYRFDITLLARRLVTAIDWTMHQSELESLPIGLFGASTGAAAALVAATERPKDVCAIVSRGGRPDLASNKIALVQAPTLLIVGGRDTQVQVFNKKASEQLTVPHKLLIVPEATHLFEEPGKLEEVARHAVDWFEKYCLSQTRSAGEPATRSDTTRH